MNNEDLKTEIEEGKIKVWVSKPEPIIYFTETSFKIAVKYEIEKYLREKGLIDNQNNMKEE